MSQGKLIFLVLIMLLLNACAEGGIGGTGSITMPINGLSLDGQGNKGPFVSGAVVRVSSLTNSNYSQLTRVKSSLGAYKVIVELNKANRIDVSGKYLSEHFGTIADEPITLSGIIVGTEGAIANVNIATHLIHKRVLVLIEAGISPQNAIISAQSELTLALSSLLSAPVNPLVFSNLAVINASPSIINPEGDAWLLALTSIVEQTAINNSEINSTALGLELSTLLFDLSTNFSANGTLELGLVDRMLLARGRINPDTIYMHLLAFNQSLGIFTVNGAVITLGVNSGSAVISDMNRFIDTDGDGIANSEDEDDDNDGILDAVDTTPYGF